MADLEKSTATALEVSENAPANTNRNERDGQNLEPNGAPTLPDGKEAPYSDKAEVKAHDKDTEKPQDADQDQDAYNNGGSAQNEYKQEGHSNNDDSSDQDKKDKKNKDKDEEGKDDEQPAGGYDATPIPNAPPGYTIKITFHRATNLPMADINSLSSDPYVLAQLNTNLRTRHKEDPPLRFRTPTIRRNTNPEWNTEWIIANVPASGFKLKARIYDEDPADHDDRLGNVHVDVPRLDEHWSGIHEQEYKIKKRMGSKRAYLIRFVASCFKLTKHLNGRLVVSVEMLGRTECENGGRVYTVGPLWWTKHYSPLLGRITGQRTPGMDKNGKKAERYNFQANQIQLPGPVPDKLYHRYVEFKSFVKGMFTSTGLRGMVLSKALHHQHARVYNFDRSTKYGVFEDRADITKQFLELVHYDQGGRIFTYVLTLDSLWRFTETGNEFGIDMLSKHTMHSDVSIYIAFSGEFFIRRLKYADRPPPDQGGDNPSHPPGPVSGGPPDDDPPKDPSHYELVIDNDSGTYRPNADLLPLLREYLERSLPGLKVSTLDCQNDAEKMKKMKDEQRELKKKEGDGIVYYQGDREGSISSSDEEALDKMEQGTHTDRGVFKTIKSDLGHANASRISKWKGSVKGRDGKPETEIDEDSDPSKAAAEAQKVAPHVNPDGTAYFSEQHASEQGAGTEKAKTQGKMEDSGMVL